MEELYDRVGKYAQLSPEEIEELLEEIHCPICGTRYEDEFFVQECLEVLHWGPDGDTILVGDNQGKTYLISPWGVTLQKRRM